jgi:hypothetical protein
MYITNFPSMQFNSPAWYFFLVKKFSLAIRSPLEIRHKMLQIQKVV